MKLYSVSWPGFGVDDSIYGAESLDDLTNQIGGITEIKKVSEAEYIFCFENGLTVRVEEAEIKPGEIFRIIE